MKEAIQRRPWPNCPTRLADSRIDRLYNFDKRSTKDSLRWFVDLPTSTSFNFALMSTNA
ncbi:hypothetical protein RBSWK_06394 [Rhodopirellula baltica SWK14]|uniref:Uncharacterized protein n=1 Tax=Rhodopirellula baltica SWK14 TaxID=993516 RepID=L7C6N9_RHOBT|nr:hypothetical protein RBSWK_06394 [Rhodopirellula baltica SWK14]